MVAYNLMSLFRQVPHRNQAQPKLSTLRFNCFAVGNWIQIKELIMSVLLKRRQWYDSLFSNVNFDKLPLSLTGQFYCKISVKYVIYLLFQYKNGMNYCRYVFWYKVKNIVIFFLVLADGWSRQLSGYVANQICSGKFFLVGLLYHRCLLAIN